jgi:hypothetical protein
MSGEALFTLPQIAKKAGAEYRTLKQWRDRGIIAPSVKINATGKAGCPEWYSERDAEVISSLAELRRRGLDLIALAVVAAAWREGEPFPECPICHRSHLKVPVLSTPTEPGEKR